MPVLTKYIVEHNGIEKMTFISKAEAEAYDKLLNITDKLSEVLTPCECIEHSDQREAIALFLAKNKDILLDALNPRKKSSSKPKKETQPPHPPQMDLADAAPRKPLADLVIEPDDTVIYEEEETTIQLDEDILDREPMNEDAA